MKITVVFPFFRFLANILLLVVVTVEVTALSLVVAWICKKGLVFRIWSIAFSAFISFLLYLFVV